MVVVLLDITNLVFNYLQEIDDRRRNLFFYLNEMSLRIGIAGVSRKQQQPCRHSCGRSRNKQHRLHWILLSLFPLFGCILVHAFSNLSPISSSTTITKTKLNAINLPKRILVTGGNKGIGRAICEKLLKDYDDTIVILSCRNEALGKKAIEEILIQGPYDDRIQLLPMDVSDEISVQNAVHQFLQLGSKQQNNNNNTTSNDITITNTPELYGIINNAGIGWGYSPRETIQTNYFGPRRVNGYFSPYIQRPGGRIVNVASASGPNYVQNLDDNDEMKLKLTKPWLLPYGISDVDEIATRFTRQHTKIIQQQNSYGISKALLNAYTVLHAKDEPTLFINSCSPGFIKTDLTYGKGATNEPSSGAIPPCWLMMDERQIPLLPSGRYYGSDCLRSPLHYYRDPGELPYDDNNEDIIRRPDRSAVIRRR